MILRPFTSRRSESVAAWGEQGLIRALRQRLGSVCPPSPRGIGDDCAVLEPSQRPQLVTVDPVILGRHFDARSDPRAVGRKLLKRNLSDIAAMGGRPRAAVIALTLDPRTRQTWITEFYRGIAETARAFAVEVIGGDVAQAENTLSASLTLLGEASGSRVLTRAGARLGDTLWVTGRLGNTLRSGHHLEFMPRLAEGAWLAARPEVRAMMDVSDGLAKDLWALTPPRALPALEAALLPRRRGASVADALCDGEDYELVLALAGNADSSAFARAWSRRFKRTPITRIGKFVSERQLPPEALDLASYRGFEHLR